MRCPNYVGSCETLSAFTFGVISVLDIMFYIKFLLCNKNVIGLEYASKRYSCFIMCPLEDNYNFYHTIMILDLEIMIEK